MKMIVIYNIPKHKAAFGRHYTDITVPLVRKLAGLRKYELSMENTFLSPTGHSSVYMIVTLYFENYGSHQELSPPLRTRPARLTGKYQRLKRMLFNYINMNLRKFKVTVENYLERRRCLFQKRRQTNFFQYRFKNAAESAREGKIP